MAMPRRAANAPHKQQICIANSAWRGVTRIVRCMRKGDKRGIGVGGGNDGSNE